MTSSFPASDPSPMIDRRSFIMDYPELPGFQYVTNDTHSQIHQFAKECYERSKGEVFSSCEDAYQDWLLTGRGAGLSYFPGKDTLLKIILKVKDEPELLEKWIEHHAAITGYHNLIIVDCGSSSAEHWAILDRYKGRLLVLKYKRYYDSLHSVQMNQEFYSFLFGNCKYLCVLDADEFLFGYRDRTLSAQHVLPVLRSGDESLYAGTWFHNTLPLTSVNGVIDWTQPIRCSLDKHHLFYGTITGKCIIRSPLPPQVNHIGHNLADKELLARVTPASFGKIGVLHLTNLGLEINRSRSLKHLYAKQIVPPNLPADQIEGALKKLAGDDTVHISTKRYITRYLDAGDTGNEIRAYFDTKLLAGPGMEENAPFSNVIETYDFASVLEAKRRGLQGS